MKTIQDYYIEAQLSLAAYGTFQPGKIDPVDLVNKAVGMSQSQAVQFASEWTVVDQFTDWGRWGRTKLNCCYEREMARYVGCFRA